MANKEQVIKGLEREIARTDLADLEWLDCVEVVLLRDALALLKSLSAFKEYFDGLYGQGLDVANYHLNGATEPFDNFYDSAMEEYENS